MKIQQIYQPQKKSIYRGYGPKKKKIEISGNFNEKCY